MHVRAAPASSSEPLGGGLLTEVTAPELCSAVQCSWWEGRCFLFPPQLPHLWNSATLNLVLPMQLLIQWWRVDAGSQYIYFEILPMILNKIFK